MPSLTRYCPAKVNLYLKVVGRRADGYHNLVSVMQPLTLADELTLELSGTTVHLECNHPGLPTDERNLAMRAARLFQTVAGRPAGLRLRLHKRIPVAAGLGGGSSDAAGVLRGLNDLAGHPLTEADLHRLAARLGADVPFFLGEGPALARGIGTDLKALELPEFWFVLINPGFAVDTGWVYRNLQLDGTRLSEDNLLAAVDSGLQRPEDLSWLTNDLESVTLRRYPEMEAWKAALRQRGAQVALMSGSGPTVFGIFPDEESSGEAAATLRGGEQVWVAMTRGLSGRCRTSGRGETHP